MNKANFWFLMAAIYTAPHMNSAMSILLGYALFVVGFYFQRNGEQNK